MAESYWTVNYLFAAYLQHPTGGGHKVVRVEKVRPGKARFYFDLDRTVADALFLKFHDSDLLAFETIRKRTIDLAYR